MASDKRRRLGIASVVLSLTLAMSARAYAQPEVDSETRSIARELALQGAEAFERKDYPTALDRFQRAATLFRAPSIVVMLARSLAQMGRFLEALDRYEETQRLPLAPDAPEAFRLAVDDARSEARALRARLPRLEVRTNADAPPKGLSVTLDGRPVSEALLNVERPVDPGTHQLSVTAPGSAPFHEDFSMSEGERRVITLPELRPPAAHAEVLVAPRATDTAPARTWAVVLSGVGVAGIGVGITTGLVALSHRSDLEAECHPGCPSSARDELSAYRTNRTVSFVSLGLGSVALGAGAYLWFSSSKSASLSASVVPGGFKLAGAF